MVRRTTSTTVFETERLIARAWKLADAEAAFAFWGDAEVMRYVGAGETHENLAATRRCLESAIEYQEKHGYCRWAIVEKDSGEIVGSCGFMYIVEDLEVDLGYYLAKRYWRRGYATEAAQGCLRYAFDHLAIKTVTAAVDVRNERSQKVLEKSGFVFREIRHNYDGTTEKFYVVEKSGAPNVR